MKRRNFLLKSTALIATPALARFSFARAADVADPNRLKGELTPVGADPTASSSGLVPAWTGGAKVPPGWSQGQDLFAGEEPLFSVTLENMAQYEHMLAEGQKLMLQRFGAQGYRLDVYPSHRTASAPQYVYDNSYKNVTRVQPVPQGLHYGFTGGAGGVPFPILSQDPDVAGLQAIWNHLIVYDAPYRHYKLGIVIVGNNQRTIASGLNDYIRNLYYDPDATPENLGVFYRKYYIEDTAPANLVGQKFTQFFSSRILESPDIAYEYLVGEGRIRQAPSADYDIPTPSYGDVVDEDESSCFEGAPDRYDWKLVGKQEMIVPYNNYKLYHSQVEDALGLDFPNPDLVRYEVHRCLVVEARVRPGYRMNEPFRRFYIDEDTWWAISSDSYDGQGNYWKLCHTLLELYPEVPGNFQVGSFWFNLQAKQYVAFSIWYAEQKGAYSAFTTPPVDFAPKPASMWDPQNMANSGGL